RTMRHAASISADLTDMSDRCRSDKFSSIQRQFIAMFLRQFIALGGRQKWRKINVILNEV
ncbi:hypothetical protein, partial [Bacillus rugosus]|uniref:hypothetical protein n=1 Tax=Bacillus rugosus TaxID=2715209 RepID=UPI001C30F56D